MVRMAFTDNMQLNEPLQMCGGQDHLTVCRPPTLSLNWPLPLPPMYCFLHFCKRTAKLSNTPCLSRGVRKPCSTPHRSFWAGPWSTWKCISKTFMHGPYPPSFREYTQSLTFLSPPPPLPGFGLHHPHGESIISMNLKLIRINLESVVQTRHTILCKDCGLYKPMFF